MAMLAQEEEELSPLDPAHYGLFSRRGIDGGMPAECMTV
jgi:hypothetical protein